MSVKAGAVTTTVTASVLYTPPAVPSRVGAQIVVTNEDATNAVRLGDKGVTTASGFLLAKGATATLPLDGAVIYVIPVAGTPVVSYYTNA
ncbi:hypothetical protein [Streptomyces mirabilis]|uniref:hypothetical protein n=1 Tax=Streptomyces mirabilis TaxID=68239 RepID=UPI00368C7820